MQKFSFEFLVLLIFENLSVFHLLLHIILYNISYDFSLA